MKNDLPDLSPVIPVARLEAPEASGSIGRYGVARRVGGQHRCPRCKGPLYRISRQFIDRLMSCFIEVRRYRCQSSACGWEGSLRAIDYSSATRGGREP